MILKLIILCKAIGQSTFGAVKDFKPEQLTRGILDKLDNTEDRYARRLISAVEDLKSRLDS